MSHPQNTFWMPYAKISFAGGITEKGASLENRGQMLTVSAQVCIAVVVLRDIGVTCVPILYSELGRCTCWTLSSVNMYRFHSFVRCAC